MSTSSRNPLISSTAYFWIDQDDCQTQGRPSLGRDQKLPRPRSMNSKRSPDVRQNTTSNNSSGLHSRPARSSRRFAAARRFEYDRASLFTRWRTALREVRGEIISLRDLRYVDGPQVDKLEDAMSSKRPIGSRTTALSFCFGPTPSPYEQGRKLTSKASIRRIDQSCRCQTAEEEHHMPRAGELRDADRRIVSNLEDRRRHAANQQLSTTSRRSSRKYSMQARAALKKNKDQRAAVASKGSRSSIRNSSC